MNRWRENDFSFVWLYPRDGRFVLSDDYVTWAAIKRGSPDVVPAWILGMPPNNLAQNVQGPMTLDAVKRALGYR